jgi:hypothetical protein
MWQNTNIAAKIHKKTAKKPNSIRSNKKTTKNPNYSSTNRRHSEEVKHCQACGIHLPARIGALTSSNNTTVGGREQRG